MQTFIGLLPGVTPGMNFEFISSREILVTLQTSKCLLPGVNPSMNFKAADCRENFATLQTLTILLPGVSLQVFFQGSLLSERLLTRIAVKRGLSRMGSLVYLEATRL